MKKIKVAIIGGGLTGLVTAYKLAKNGHDVSILEKGSDLGGLMSGFEINGTSLEKAYHHIFRTDKYIINLVNELGLEDKLIWNESSIGLYYDGNLYPFVTPIDLLKFKPLDIISKIRLGLVGIYLQKTKNWKKFIDVSAVKWLEKWCGKKGYKVVWEPLLKGKFHDYYHNVSMAWMWARIHTRANSKVKGEVKEKLGYLEGGFEIISKALEKNIKKNKGKIILNTNIENIIETNGKVKITIHGEEKLFDKVIACIPSSVLSRLIDQNKYNIYIDKLNNIDYLGSVMLIFSSKQCLSKYYWHNINDCKSPFLAFIQHTNLIDKSNYNNEHIYYLGAYLPHDHKYFKWSDEKIQKEFFDYLNKIFPKFDQKQISSKHIFKLIDAQHVVDVNYKSKILDYQTPINNLYLSNFSQIFPEDRGVNFAVREGCKISELVG